MARYIAIHWPLSPFLSFIYFVFSHTQHRFSETNPSLAMVWCVVPAHIHFSSSVCMYVCVCRYLCTKAYIGDGFKHALCLSISLPVWCIFSMGCWL